MASLVPLFPLPLVLFPDTPLPLHIFEPRYREMTAECLRLKQSFGVLRATHDGFARAGCLAEILEVTRRYDDGRMDILTLGQQRFDVMSVDEERAFLRGEVSIFQDEDEDEVEDDAEAEPESQAAAAALPPNPPLRKRALDLQKQLVALSGEKNPELPPAMNQDHPQLSFQLAAAMPLDLDFKQSLLVLRSEAQRLKTLVAYYEALLPRLRHAIHARTKAGGNGHAAGH